LKVPRSIDRGPIAGTDFRHRVSLAGTVTAKWGIRFNPLLTANTGPPFDITTGHDFYGDTLFNSRPGIATVLNLIDNAMKYSADRKQLSIRGVETQ
jgi:hypothetical protein